MEKSKIAVLQEAAAVQALAAFLGEFLTGALTIDKNQDGRIQFWSETVPFGARVAAMVTALIPHVAKLPEEVTHATKEQIQAAAATFALNFQAENGKIEEGIEHIVNAVTSIILAVKAFKSK